MVGMSTIAESGPCLTLAACKWHSECRAAKVAPNGVSEGTKSGVAARCMIACAWKYASDHKRNQNSESSTLIRCSSDVHHSLNYLFSGHIIVHIHLATIEDCQLTCWCVSQICGSGLTKTRAISIWSFELNITEFLEISVCKGACTGRITSCLRMPSSIEWFLA